MYTCEGNQSETEGEWDQRRAADICIAFCGIQNIDKHTIAALCGGNGNTWSNIHAIVNRTFHDQRFHTNNIIISQHKTEYM